MYISVGWVAARVSAGVASYANAERLPTEITQHSQSVGLFRDERLRQRAAQPTLRKLLNPRS